MMNTAHKKSNSMRLTIILFLLVLAIIIIPQLMHKDAEFGGADGEAETLITEIAPTYKAWFSSLYEPASGEIESLLFASQAALGAGIIGYYVGTTRTKKKYRDIEAEKYNDNR